MGWERRCEHSARSAFTECSRIHHPARKGSTIVPILQMNKLRSRNSSHRARNQTLKTRNPKPSFFPLHTTLFSSECSQRDLFPPTRSCSPQTGHKGRGAEMQQAALPGQPHAGARDAGRSLPSLPELAGLEKGGGGPARREYSRLPQAQAAPRGASSPGTPASSGAAERGAGPPPLSGASDYFSTCGRNGRKLKSHGERAARGDSALTESRHPRGNCVRVGGDRGGGGRPAGAGPGRPVGQSRRRAGAVMAFGHC